MVAVFRTTSGHPFSQLLTTRKMQSTRYMIALPQRTSRNGSPLNGGGNHWQTAMESSPLRFVSVRYSSKCPNRGTFSFCAGYILTYYRLEMS